MQVQQVGRRSSRRGHRQPRACSASSSLPWMPPKPPLLMHSTWSPGAPRRRLRSTSLSTLSATTACAPIGASASRGVPAVVALHGRTTGRPLPAPTAAAPSSCRASSCSSAARTPRGCARSADLAAQPVDRGADRGRMVREVVVDLDAAGLAAQLQAAPHVLEAAPAPRPRPPGATPTCSAAAIAASALSWLCSPSSDHSTRADLQAAAQHVERVRLAARAQRAGLFLARAEALHLAPAAAREHALQRARRAH